MISIEEQFKENEEKMSRHKAAMNRPETKKRLSEAQKMKWRNPIFRERCSKGRPRKIQVENNETK